MTRTSWNAADLLAARFPEPRWAVDGVIAEGCTILAGAPKLGKSWLVLGTAVAVATGGRALGRIPVEQGDALYLALEDTPRRLQSRLRLVLGANGPVPHRLDIGTEWPTLDEGGEERIRAWLDAHTDARLVAVDVLARIRPRTSVRADRYDADYHSVVALKQIADDYSVALVAVHHTRKGASDDWIDGVSGTLGLVGAADSTVVLTRSRGAAGAVLKVTGRDVEEAEHALDFDPATATWKLLDGPASDYELSEQRRVILATVRDAAGIGPKAIAEQTGLDYDLVRQTVRRMVDAEQIDTDGNGHYFPVCTPVTPVTPVTPTLSVVTAVTDVTPPYGVEQ